MSEPTVLEYARFYGIAIPHTTIDISLLLSRFSRPAQCGNFTVTADEEHLLSKCGEAVQRLTKLDEQEKIVASPKAQEFLASRRVDIDLAQMACDLLPQVKKRKSHKLSLPLLCTGASSLEKDLRRVRRRTGKGFIADAIKRSGLKVTSSQNEPFDLNADKIAELESCFEQHRYSLFPERLQVSTEAVALLKQVRCTGGAMTSKSFLPDAGRSRRVQYANLVHDDFPSDEEGGLRDVRNDVDALSKESVCQLSDTQQELHEILEEGLNETNQLKGNSQSQQHQIASYCAQHLLPGRQDPIGLSHPNNPESPLSALDSSDPIISQHETALPSLYSSHLIDSGSHNNAAEVSVSPDYEAVRTRDRSSRALVEHSSSNDGILGIEQVAEIITSPRLSWNECRTRSLMRSEQELLLPHDEDFLLCDEDIVDLKTTERSCKLGCEKQLVSESKDVGHTAYEQGRDGTIDQEAPEDNSDGLGRGVKPERLKDDMAAQNTSKLHIAKLHLREQTDSPQYNITRPSDVSQVDHEASPYFTLFFKSATGMLSESKRQSQPMDCPKEKTRQSIKPEVTIRPNSCLAKKPAAPSADSSNPRSSDRMDVAEDDATSIEQENDISTVGRGLASCLTTVTQSVCSDHPGTENIMRKDKVMNSLSKDVPVFGRALAQRRPLLPVRRQKGPPSAPNSLKTVYESDSLSAFLELKGKRFNLSSDKGNERATELRKDLVESTQVSSSTMFSIMEEENVSLDPDEITATREADVNLREKCTIVVNERTLQEKLRLVQYLERQINLNIEYHSFDCAGPDIILNSNACVVVSSLRLLDQRPLPGIKTDTGLSFLHDRVIHLLELHNVVLVLLHYISFSEVHDFQVQQASILQFTRFCHELKDEIRFSGSLKPIFVPSPTAADTCVVVNNAIGDLLMQYTHESRLCIAHISDEVKLVREFT